MTRTTKPTRSVGRPLPVGAVGSWLSGTRMDASACRSRIWLPTLEGASSPATSSYAGLNILHHCAIVSPLMVGAWPQRCKGPIYRLGLTTAPLVRGLYY